MNKILSNYFILTLSLIFIININSAQEFSKSGINMGIKIGGSRLLGEIPKGFSGIINEFDNNIGFASAFELSKYVSSRWEIGCDFSYSVLNGNTYSPDFSAEGFQQGIPSEINDPVEYKNKLLGFNFVFRYFFKAAGSESAFIPFVCAGGGIINYNSKLKYIDAPNDELIFGKGIEGYTTLITPIFFVGTGFKTSLSSHFYLLSSLDFNLVNYDFLDVMHNYSGGSRLGIAGLSAALKVGIFYNTVISEGNKNKNGSNKKGGSSNNSLPFAR